MPKTVGDLAWVVDNRPDSARKRDLGTVSPVRLIHYRREGGVEVSDSTDIVSVDLVAVRLVGCA